MKKRQEKDAVLKDALNNQTLEKLKMLKKSAAETEERNKKEARAKKEEESCAKKISPLKNY
ncbi:DUF3886 domain-containing protein [Jeotgalibacillus sp. JSM ZJ347]|uniref:DUF3886 domain-containing protein n=1 Tax=Jeotgalibacillus sp. JSM ZJ347 TaxID=3342117 RepID=UPI0035A898F3